MTKRQELIKFAKLNGLSIKGERCCGNIVITAWCEATNWLDFFDSWELAHEFFLSAVTARHNGQPYPWTIRKAA